VEQLQARAILLEPERGLPTRPRPLWPVWVRFQPPPLLAGRPPRRTRTRQSALGTSRPPRLTGTRLLSRLPLPESGAFRPQWPQEQPPQLPTPSVELGRSRPLSVMVTETRLPPRWTVPVTLPAREPGPRARPRQRLLVLEAFPRPPPQVERQRPLPPQQLPGSARSLQLLRQVRPTRLPQPQLQRAPFLPLSDTATGTRLAARLPEPATRREREPARAERAPPLLRERDQFPLRLQTGAQARPQRLLLRRESARFPHRSLGGTLSRRLRLWRVLAAFQRPLLTARPRRSRPLPRERGAFPHQLKQAQPLTPPVRSWESVQFLLRPPGVPPIRPLRTWSGPGLFPPQPSPVPAALLRQQWVAWEPSAR
jgi:hypothetical protein